MLEVTTRKLKNLDTEPYVRNVAIHISSPSWVRIHIASEVNLKLE